MQKQLVTTSDGSHSIFIAELDEHYHSVHGAIRESKHVFIEAGLKFVLNLPSPPDSYRDGEGQGVRLLEVGLGTGLNCFLTFLHNGEGMGERSIEYTAIEAYPLEEDVVKRLNYPEQLNARKFKNIFFDIHKSAWNRKVELADDFILKKINDKFQDINFDEKYDLVYFDAFAPRVQPEMWTNKIFEKIYDSMNKDAVLVTYCAKGEVKRTLKTVGFEVETLQGPPGKREMIRVRKR